MDVKTTVPYENVEPVSYIKVDIDHKYHSPDVRLFVSHVMHSLSRATMGLLDDFKDKYKVMNMVISFSGKDVYLKTLYAVV